MSSEVNAEPDAVEVHTAELPTPLRAAGTGGTASFGPDDLGHIGAPIYSHQMLLVASESERKVVAKLVLRIEDHRRAVAHNAQVRLEQAGPSN